MLYIIIMLICLAFLLIPVVISLFSGSAADAAEKSGLKFPLSWFYQGAFLINEFLTKHGPGTGMLRGKADIIAKKLYPGRTPEGFVRDFAVKRIMILYGGIVLSVCVILLYMLSVYTGAEQLDKLTRPEADQSGRSVKLKVIVGEDEQEVDVSLAPVRLDDEGVQQLFKDVRDYIDRTFIGENKDSDHVIYPLVFANDYPNKNITIEWQPSDYNLIHQDGSIGGPDSIHYPAVTTVTALIKYADRTDIYEKKVTLVSPVISEEEKLAKRINEAISDEDEASRNESIMCLPDEIGGKAAIWYTYREDIIPILVFVCIFATGAFFYLYEDRLRKTTLVREDELVREYPGFVHRMVLLTGAGLTVRKSWEQLTYEYGKGGDGQKQSFLYREMRYTLGCMNAGMPEIQAYQEFGKRVTGSGYTKFCQLLVQMIRKGSSGMQEMMLREAADAQKQRRDIAKRAGEVAGTKLLMPMMLLLLVVLVVVMIPAMFTV